MKIFYSSRKSENLIIWRIWSPNAQKFLLKKSKIHDFSDFRRPQKIFLVGYYHKSENLSGQYLKLKLCQIWGLCDTYFLLDQQKFHTPPNRWFWSSMLYMLGIRPRNFSWFLCSYNSHKLFRIFPVTYKQCLFKKSTFYFDYMSASILFFYVGPLIGTWALWV